MAYGVTYITTQGAILAAKTLQSKTLKFSRFKIGSGSLQEGSVAEIKALTDLVNEEMDFDITKISRESATQVTVRGLFKNTDAESGFWLRELGLYAIDPDTEDEILFAYINYDSEAEYNNVEVYVSFLRKKLKLIKSHVKIKEVRGIGYKMEVEND